MDKDPYLLKSGINFAPFLSRDLSTRVVLRLGVIVLTSLFFTLIILLFS